MRSSLNKYFIPLITLLVLTAVLLIINLRPEEGDLRLITNKLESKIIEIEKDFYKTASNPDLIEETSGKGFSSTYFKELMDKPYSFAIYVGDTLKFWNTVSILPYYSVANLPDDGTYLRLKNGSYLALKKMHSSQHDEISIVGLISIKSNYLIENRYLKNVFNPILKVPEYLDLSVNEISGGEVVKNLNRKSLFYTYINPIQKIGKPNVLALLLTLIALGLLFVFIGQVAHQISENNKPVVGFVFLSLSLLLVRYVTLSTPLFSSQLQNLGLFDPQYYATSDLNPSLGDLLINALLIFWLVYFFIKQIDLSPFYKFSTKVQTLITGILFFCIMELPAWMVAIYKGFVIDSKISFDVNNILSLTVYSVIGFICLSLLLFSYFLLGRKFLQFIRDSNISRYPRLMAFIAAMVVFLILRLITGLDYVSNTVIIWTLTYVALFYAFIHKHKSLASFSGLVLFISLFAAYSAVLLNHFNIIKEQTQRKILARKLATERDPITEYLFTDVQKGLLNDSFLKNHFKPPYMSRNEVFKRIRKKYFGGYFNQYELDIFTINPDGISFFGGRELTTKELEARFEGDVENTENEALFYVSKASGNYIYLGNIQIIDDQKFLGTLLIELKPKTYRKSNVYPELLLEERIRPSDDYNKYEYAVYSKSTLIKQNGKFPSRPRDFMALDIGVENHFYDTEQSSVLIHRPDPYKTVIVKKPVDKRIYLVSLFSYLFLIFLSFIFLVILLQLIFQIIRGELSLRDFFSLSLRQKIQSSMVLILILSFGIIGFVTIQYFNEEYNDYHEQRLVRKEQAVLSAVEYYLKDNPYMDYPLYMMPQLLEKSMSSQLIALSDIHSMDMNVFAMDGRLITSSQPAIFEKSLIDKIMNPVAFRNMSILKRAQWIQHEHIGLLKYLSIYVPISSESGRTIAYLHLPYFAKERNLRQDISSFLIALVNVYVLLLLGGALLAYLLSRSITTSLSVISEKLKFVELGKKNEPIRWDTNDEIGKLVAEYNKMINELENSAHLLAKSERESAWREMAKQIAHEIKNPLTPMKLSVQHLLRALADNSPKSMEIGKKVAKTLLEQIDNLSFIATAFSSFAKMPKAENEVINLNEVTESVAELFINHDKADLVYEKPEGNFIVFADRSQLVRAFTNLIKNAVQAIPEDEKGVISFGLSQQSDHYLIEVTDNGIGIPEEQKDAVFVPNFTTKSSGTGLGLAMTKQIIDGAGGRIWFESEIGKGTSFYVELPRYNSV